MSNFEIHREFGTVGEISIEKLLQHEFGYSVVQIYNATDKNKGPRLQLARGQNLILPDLLCFKLRISRWVEVKRKSRCGWFRKKKIWTTGIDRHLFDMYQKVKELTGIQVYILFVHDTPYYENGRPSPLGLFGDEIEILSQRLDHKSNRYGSTGMIYWDIESLTQLCEISTLKEYIEGGIDELP